MAKMQRLLNENKSKRLKLREFPNQKYCHNYIHNKTPKIFWRDKV